MWSFTTISECVMEVEDTLGAPGDINHVVQVFGRWNFSLGAYQINLLFDDNQIDIVDITFDGTIGETAAFTPVNLSIPGRVTAAAIWMPPTYPEPGEGPLLNLIIDIHGDADIGPTILDLEHYLGTPPVKCKYTPTDGGAGDEIIPDMVDGTLLITEGNNAPYVPSNPSPGDGEKGVALDALFSWTGGDPDLGDTVTYDVYFGETASPIQVASNISVTNYNPGPLEYMPAYYWKIVSWDSEGRSTEGPLWYFSTLESIMSVDNAVGVPGQSGLIIKITGMWEIELDAYQMCLYYDYNQIEIVDVTFEGTIGETADFTPVDLSTPGMITAAAIWLPSEYPSYGAGVLFNLVINIKSDADVGDTVLDLDNYLGDPTVRCKYTPPDGGAGDEIYPILIDGILTISDHICGDVNGSGNVDIDDVVYLINYIFAGGPAPVPQECIGDANGSGNVDIDDVVYIISYIFTGGPPPVTDCCG